jgi:hypothetical protein
VVSRSGANGCDDRLVVDVENDMGPSPRAVDGKAIHGGEHGVQLLEEDIFCPVSTREQVRESIRR